MSTIRCAARSESSVTLAGSTQESHSGYITVNAQYNSNIFFWFFLAQVSLPSHPLSILMFEGFFGRVDRFYGQVEYLALIEEGEILARIY